MSFLAITMHKRILDVNDVSQSGITNYFFGFMSKYTLNLCVINIFIMCDISMMIVEMLSEVSKFNCVYFTMVNIRAFEFMQR